MDGNDVPTKGSRPRAGSGGAFLQSFWDLAGVETDKRLAAGAQIVDHLVETQGATKDGLVPDVSYAVKRLVRGLSSSREAARQGFGTCLVEVLVRVPAVAPEEVLDQLLKETQTRAKMKGSEERDALLGRLFGCASLVRSGRLAESQESWTKTFNTVVELFGSKSWIQEAVGDTLLGLIWQVPPSSISTECYSALSGLLGGSDAKLGDLSPEQLQLALGLHRYLQRSEKKVEGSEELPKMITANKPLLRPARMLKVTETLKKATGSFPKVHSVFRWAFAGMIAKEIKGSNEAGEASELLKDFWTTMIDGILANGTHQTKGVVLLLVQMLSPALTPQEISLVLSPNVVRTMVNAAKKPENHLYQTARQTLEHLVQATSNSPSCRLAAVTSLISDGHMDFDKVTKTSTIAKLLEGLDKAAVEQYLHFLQDVICKPEDQTDKNQDQINQNQNEVEELDSVALNKVDAKKIWAIDSLVAAVARNSKLQSHKQWISQAAKLLLSVAFYDTSTIDSPKIKKSKKKRKESMGSLEIWSCVTFTTKVREHARRKFFAIATDFAMEKDGTGGPEFLVNLHEFFKLLGSKGAEALTELDEESQAAQEMILVVVKEAAESCKDHKLRIPFSEMLLLVGLQLLEGEEESSLAEAILDLCKCFRKLLGMSTDDSDKDESDEDEQEDPMAVFADAASSILSAASEHCARGIREVVKKAWGAGCVIHQLKSPALAVLLDTVCNEQNSTEAEEDNEDEEDGGQEDSEDENDPERNKRSVEGNLSNQGKSLENKSDEEEEEDQEDEKIEEEGLMDLLEGRAVDAETEDNALAAMLALRKSARKSGQKDQERARYQLSLRVLDLLEIVFQKQRDNPVIIGCLAPLVRAIGKLTQKVKAQSKIAEATSLLQRLSSLIQNKVVKCHPKLNEENNVDACQKCLADLMDAAKKFQGSSKMVACALSCCIRALQHAPNPENNNAVVKDIYGDALKNYYSVRSSHLHSIIFTELVERFPSLGILILPNLILMAKEARSAYLRSEGFRIISILLRRRSNLDQIDQQLLKSYCLRINEAFEMILAQDDKIAATVFSNRLDTVLQMALLLYQTGRDLKWECSDASKTLDLLNDNAKAVPKKAQKNFENLKKFIKEQKQILADSSPTSNAGNSQQDAQSKKKKRKKKKK